MSRHAIDIVMLVKDRPRLTRQAVRSLMENTSSHYHLTILDDNSAYETSELLDGFRGAVCQVWHSRYQQLGPGRARNAAIRKADQWGRGQWLYLTDNDSYHLPGWDEILLAGWQAIRGMFKGPLALGGYCHPFQQRGAVLGHVGAITNYSVRELEALGLLSWLMEWQTWDELGPLEPAPMINGSEDWDYCQRIRKAGGKVAVVEPAVVINCGLTSTDGKLSVGHEHIHSQVFPEGVAVE